MLENRLLRRIFGRKQEDGENCIINCFHNLYSSKNTAKTMKSRRMRCVGM
jgi:hypothetical protein